MDAQHNKFFYSEIKFTNHNKKKKFLAGACVLFVYMRSNKLFTDFDSTSIIISVLSKWEKITFEEEIKISSCSV